MKTSAILLFTDIVNEIKSRKKIWAEHLAQIISVTFNYNTLVKQSSQNTTL